MKMESFVVPAWMAGIQMRGMRLETSMSAWIPALHAGMTESRSRTKTDPGPPPRVFSKEITKATKNSETFDHKLRDLRGLQNLCARRKSYDHTKHLGDSSRQGAKHVLSEAEGSAKFG
jgi:hypothetical protein